MNQYVKENKTEYFSPIYKVYKQDLKSIFETDNPFPKIMSSKKISTIHCNSLFAEETINVIIDYFNDEYRLNNNFKKSVLNEIKNIEFAFPTDNKKLELNIELNSENSFTASANGMKNILEAFIKYSDFISNSNKNCFEDIEYVTESTNEAYDSSKVWVSQTIDEPWFK